jgi:hypothetical protein
VADAPGLFSVLVRDGVIPRAEVEGLAQGLPQESFVCTGAREGEAFDSTRWPLAYDAALAEYVAARLDPLDGDGFALPPPREGGTSSMFVVSAGSRALVALSFGERPRWVQLVAQLRGRPLDLRDGAWTLVVPDRSLPVELQPAAAVASLVTFVSVSLDAHLALHPEDGARFPVLDDAALARIFG